MASELSILNDPPRVVDGPQLLHHLIRWDKYRDTCALDFTSYGRRQQYTYHEIKYCIESLSNQILDKLSALNTRTNPSLSKPLPQHIVPILLPQSPSLYISQLAILESGGAFCPINLDAPNDRIKFIAKDVSANLIITTSEFKDAVSWKNGPAVILVDEFPQAFKNVVKPIPPRRATHPWDLAYVMYTSGSTGQPKGVMLSHLAVSQSLLAHEGHIPSFKRFLQFAAPSFDVSVFEIFFPLIRGCTIVGCNRTKLLNDLPRMLSELEVDAAELTPTVVGSLLQSRANAPGLKLLLTIGEMLTSPIVEEFGRSSNKEGILYAMYGPTEAAIHCTIYQKMESSAKPGNIGVPLDTVSSFIAAPSQPDQPGILLLAVGEVGELVLSGPQLAAGYINRPEENTAAFISFDDRVYYRTGDRARQLQNGTIEIMGRIDGGQVKLRGQRVEIGEIEEIVYKYPGIKTASAIVVGSSLIVFALVDGDSIISEHVLETCRQWLPGFMVPSEIVLLREFPYLPSGKVDKMRLKEDHQKRLDDTIDEDSFPKSSLEIFVKRTLEELIGSFSSSTHLAAAGIDSLFAIRLATKLRSAGFDVPTIAILKAEKVHDLVHLCEYFKSKEPLIDSAISKQFEGTLAGLESSEGIETIMPCTPLQTAMLSETAVNKLAYWNFLELELPLVNDLDHLLSSLRTLARRSAILRTGFIESAEPEGFSQIIWTDLASEQIEVVESLSYVDLERNGASLLHPLFFQLEVRDLSVKMLIRLHHSIYDAWSLELLLDDLDMLQRDELPPERPPFSNVVSAYVNGILSSKTWSSKDYWKDHLAQLESRTLPSFHSRRTENIGLAISRLSTSIATVDLEAAARRLSCSPQSIFQAAYALVLSSYHGSPDICFGTVSSGRTLPIPGIEDIIGPCLATLPVRIDISTSTTIKDLVQELNATNRKHLEQSTLPLRQIKSAADINPRQALFDTLLVWQQTLHSHDHSRKNVSLVNSTDNLEFDLTLEITPGVGKIELKANYQRALFPTSQIELFLRQIEQLALAVINDESISVESIFEYLDDELLSIQNTILETGLKPGTLSSSVEQIAAKDSDRAAIDFAQTIDADRFEMQRMTYGELNARSNQLGNHLLMLNVLPDELVCICIEKSLDLYTSILATTKAGAGYLPVTPDIPNKRLKLILHEAKVKLIVAQTASRRRLRFWTGSVVYVDELDLSSLSTANIPNRASPDNLAYSVFTSGSTGKPKGVLVTQRNLLSNLDVLEDLYAATEDIRLLQSCSQAFDVSVFEIFFTWRIGGCLCSAVKDVLFKDIENIIRVLDVTHLSLTPTVAALVDPINVPKVQFLVTAGEAVTQKVFNAWAGKGLFQGYGPSETTNICTVNPHVKSHDAINNIGPPLKNTSVFVLSPRPDFALIPRGGEGEFCFGGSQVFRGYMNPDEDEGKIIDHPMYGRLYRSGDFGRLMPDGTLAFTGRRDDQTKIRGQRVELEEINNVMLRSTEVKDCVTVVVGGHDDSAQHLSCFWTSGSSALVDVGCLPPDQAVVEKLYKSLDAALPAYMVPSALVPISHLPSTSQGKIDKRLLQKLYNDLDIEYLTSVSQVAKETSNHTWSKVELDIADALRQSMTISLEEIGADSSFFSLGIDSISAISLSRTLRQKYGHKVEISDILRYASIVRLAERISSKTQDLHFLQPSTTQGADFGLNKDFIDSTENKFSQAGKEIQHISPCTPLQEAMLSAAESSSGNLYINHVIFNVHGEIKRLQACWREAISRHEILRTCFVRTGMPRYAYVQVVLKTFELGFGDCELENDDTAQLITLGGDTPALSEFEPPWRLGFVRTPESMKLVITMHHVLYDGVALAVLYEEIERIYYENILADSVSFTPFLQYMGSINPEDADRFWSSKLEGVIPTRFGTLNHKAENQPRTNRSQAKSTLTWIEHSAKKHSTSLLSICHAVWATLLSEYLQISDICFGNVVNGRTALIEGIDRLVAPCFNTIPVRIQGMHKLSYLETIRELQILNAESLPYQLTPLRRIQSKFSPDGGRLFDSLFILQQASRCLDSSIWSLEADIGAMDFPLVCEVTPRPVDNRLEIVLHSYSSVFSEEHALQILDAFCENLESALSNPRRQLLTAKAKEKTTEKAAYRDSERAKYRRQEQASREMTAIEINLRDVISSYTDVPANKISPNMSIFQLGLDSINAVQVATQLRKQGQGLMASDIMENPTIADLATFLARSSDNSQKTRDAYDFHGFDEKYREAVCSKHSLVSDEIEVIRPCTLIQLGMIAQTLRSDGRVYVNSIIFDLSKRILIPKLKRAWNTVCSEHEMLRTGFAATEDSKHPFVMVTYHKENFPLPWSCDNSEEAGDRPLLTQLLQRPWSLHPFEGGERMLLRFTAHHALYDAQSIQLILSDVAAAYASGFIPSRPSIAPLLGAILQNSEANTEARKFFWEDEDNKIVVNRFPDLTPLKVSETSSAVKELNSQTMKGELEETCRRNGVTMQAATQATWARLLAAYIGESSTTFGITLSGRSVHEDAEQISFPSIVTLPVRCRITGTNGELLSRTMTANAQLHKHQFTPLTTIQKWAGYPEGKIFDTLFAYQKVSQLGGSTTPPWEVVHEEASVDYAVSLEVQPTNVGPLKLRLTFRVDLIPMEHAKLLLKQYDALLLDTIQNPDSPCALPPRLSNDLLSVTAPKADILPGPVTLMHGFVEKGAKAWPKKTALEFTSCLEQGKFQGQTWTYKALNEMSNKVAHLLVRRDVFPGEIVAICFDKCPEASFAIIGILKAGCAYVALDPNAPADRLKFIAVDSGAKMILSAGMPGKNLRNLIADKVVLLDTPESLIGLPTSSPKLRREISPRDTCYCLYTSGTTGTPKGCLISHENAVQAMYGFQRLFAGHWAGDSKWLQFASFHFDVSVLEQFWSWSVGICVASAPRDLIFEDIAGAIRQLNITHIDLTPSLARLLHPDDVPSLCRGVFITGGEQLKQEILDVWGDRACIYNGYGPTEATIGCTMYPRVPKKGKPSNIGPALENVGSFVLQPGTALPVLRGGIGELAVSGKLVGKGYLNRPELTGERFPTLEEFNERVYRTGDLVRILHNGSFIFLGRTDDQVKLRGQRLELNEINEVIKTSVVQLEEVVTLVLKKGVQQKEQLVTFFVLSSRTEVDQRELTAQMRDACTTRLPGYMVPTHFIRIDKLPLNANNKADTKRLATIYSGFSMDDLQKMSHSTQPEKGWTNDEKKVLKVLSKALNVDSSLLTRGSNVFQLGLDSISIIGFVHRLQSWGLKNATISMVRSHTTLRDLVKVFLSSDTRKHDREDTYISATQRIAAFSQRHMASICQVLGSESSAIECIAPCTPVQEGMIYRFLQSEHPQYFNKFGFNLAKNVEVERLLKAWNTVAAHLQILRTQFVATSDGHAQVVMRRAPAFWEESELCNEAMEKSIALRNPFKLVLLRSSSASVMSLHMFHGLYDGISLDMMLRCVVAEYYGLQDISYGPSFYSSLAYGPLMQVPAAQSFWRDHLRTWAPSSNPADGQFAHTVAVTGTMRRLSRLEEVRKSLGVTPQAVIQAAWVSVLQNITPSNLTIGIVTSGRSIDLPSADKVIGPLFNTVPFHVKLSEGMTASSLISRCHDFNMKMQEFQHTALREIQKWSPAKPGEQLFDSLFVFNRPESDNEDFSSGVWEKQDSEHIADYPLALEATLSPDSSTLDLIIVAQGSYVSQEHAFELLQQVEKRLSDILENDNQNLILTHESKLVHNSSTSTPSVQTNNTGVLVPLIASDSFIWTETAIRMKGEISLLASIPEEYVHESSSIFELGLDSIDVIKLSSRLKRHGIEIAVSKIIKCQSISRMSTEITQTDVQISQPSSRISLKKMSQDLVLYLKQKGQYSQEIEAVLPATPLQQTIVSEMLKSNYQRYFNIEALRLSGMVDSARLMSSIQSVIRQSPILRTRFVEVLDPHLPVSYAQIIDKEYSLSSTYVLAGDTNFENLIGKFRNESAALAAEKNVLFQVRFIRSRQSRYMLVAISHALYDGTSIRLLHDDINRAYHGQLLPRPDFKEALADVFESTTDEAKSFWKSTLSNLPAASFPRKEISQFQNPTKSYLAEKKSRIPLRDIEAFCKSSRITLQTLGQTCWALVLARLTEQLDVIFGAVLSCRDSEEANEMMFPLMNTVAVRSVLHGSLRDMLEYMQEMSDTTRQYQHFPLGTAQAYAMASRSEVSKNTSLFDTLFICQGRGQRGDGESLYESVYGASEVGFPVCVEMEIIHDTYLRWTTSCKAIARTAAETNAIITALDDVLERVIKSPEGPTIITDAHGVTVGGLPAFRRSESKQAVEVSDCDRLIREEWSETELNLRKALHELSGVAEAAITKDTTIFHLGLDSISVLKVPALLRGYGIKVKVSDVLREQTIAAMAQFIVQSKPVVEALLDIDNTISSALLHLDISEQLAALTEQIGEIEYVMPVTAGQLFMIRHWQASRGVLFYPSFTYITGDSLVREKMEKGWMALLQKHEILRTGFMEIGSEVLQVVFKNPPNDVVYFPEQAQETHDLNRPPLSLYVHDLSGTTTIILKIHHALYDGVSLPIIINELQALYRGQSPEPSTLSFKRFVAQSLAASRKPVFDTTTVHQTLLQKKWTAYLSPAISSAGSTIKSTINSAKRIEVFLKSIPFPDLAALARTHNTSIDSLLLAAISRIYFTHLVKPTPSPSHAPPPHIIFGIYLSNRAPFNEDLSSLAAPTLNILPVLVKDPLNRRLEDVARHIQRDLVLTGRGKMSCASLENIWRWTGVKVGFVINILKDAGEMVEAGVENRAVFESVQNLDERREVIVEELGGRVIMPEDGRCDAYQPTIDVEIRYREGKVDVGIFAPEELLALHQADAMVEELRNALG